MKFIALLAALCVAPAALATEYFVTYSLVYDNPNGLTSRLACSDLAAAYPEFQDFPDYPYIGGVFDVSADHANCGNCWQLAYENNTIYVLAIDAAGVGFDISKEAYIALGGTVDEGHVDATAVLVDGSYCGL